MLITLSPQKEPSFNPYTILPTEIELPFEWTEWFKLPRLPLFSVVQDTVQVKTQSMVDETRNNFTDGYICSICYRFKDDI